ncbi:NUDIX hydrolase [Goodfellowiella coeruleoviolacea]|uniref:ADP-ribose pyrophosphatase YjhB, NUDIX family n=1 Tax=Goodfellowiella coeruleoviolacea TaxID=334858 RepID=A0AAE3GBN5_9PSEU|nr:NUDIX domain-containing protein [Goodfellowiella coeruleoviolacea]MCP2164424.1 ADP-ribose pyrophosphatase YjhB, NUDIX family [Goodfellowiella coeruleoviolacea]
MARIDHYNDPHAPQATTIRTAVSAVVRDQAGRVLMIRRTDNNRYAIPGGGMEPGETVTGAVVREVGEETGINVEVTGFIGIYSNPRHVIEFSDGEVRQEFSLCFAARPIGGQVRTSDESSEVDWVEPDQLAELDIHPSIRLRIQHGLEDRTQPYYT